MIRSPTLHGCIPCDRIESGRKRSVRARSWHAECDIGGRDAAKEESAPAANGMTISSIGGYFAGTFGSDDEDVSERVHGAPGVAPMVAFPVTGSRAGGNDRYARDHGTRNVTLEGSTK